MITGGQFIDFAGKLAARQKTTEAEQRTAVSRAYFGAYDLAKCFLEHLGVKVPKRNNDFVKNCLVQCGHDVAIRAGNRLEELRRQRNRADYDLQDQWPFGGGDPALLVRHCVEAAKDVQSLLAQCNVDSVHALVKVGVEHFLKRQATIRSGGKRADPSAN